MKLSRTLFLSSLLLIGHSSTWASVELDGAEPEQKKVHRVGFVPTPEKVLSDLEKEKQKTAHKMGFSNYSMPTTTHLPAAFDLLDHVHFIFDQGDLGSCTANSIALAYAITQSVQLKKAFPMITKEQLKEEVVTLSRLEIYLKERKIEKTVDQDCGASIGSGLLALYMEGICTEKEWPYDISKFKEDPPLSAKAHDKDNRDLDGVDHDQLTPKAGHYNLTDFMRALYDGNPISMGIKLRKSFMSDEVADTGIVPTNLPNDAEEGWHAVTLVGYTAKDLIFANSWGPEWGMKGKGDTRGFFKLPKTFMTPDNVSEAWKIGRVTLPKVTAPPHTVPKINDNNTHPIVHSVIK